LVLKILINFHDYQKNKWRPEPNQKNGAIPKSLMSRSFKFSKMKTFLSVILFSLNLMIWAFFWYVISSHPNFHLPFYIAFITFLISYFILPKLFFQTVQKAFSLTTYDYIWAQLKWANGVGFTAGFIVLLLG